MARLFFAVAAFLGALSVAGGAFGAHALKGQLTENALNSFETGIRYQMYHALALLVVALLLKQNPEVTVLVIAGGCFIAGIVLFSGSLYGLSLAGIKAFGPVTPLGGVAFIAGWVCLMLASAKAF
ncbi:DUF423 domain-containing protein [Leptolyngbya sp. BC1307]|uniref:DUF423 domain-containing protein n=1 Tax=Leptolyngbya sp. BC1307 TaxID=2029589 RepID=UPI000EFAA713|nr:DUF423 domain-containing protein [Leptolyngbya sp. BC1307]